MFITRNRISNNDNAIHAAKADLKESVAWASLATIAVTIIEAPIVLLYLASRWVFFFFITLIMQALFRIGMALVPMAWRAIVKKMRK